MRDELFRKLQANDLELQNFIEHTVKKATELESELRRQKTITESLGKTLSDVMVSVETVKNQLQAFDSIRESVEHQKQWNEGAASRFTAQESWNHEAELRMGASQAQLGHTHQDIQNIKYSLLSGTQRDASPTGQEANTSSGAWETTGQRRGQTQESTRPTEVPDGVEDPAESSNQAASKAKTAWDPRPGGSKKPQPTNAQGPGMEPASGLTGNGSRGMLPPLFSVPPLPSPHLFVSRDTNSHSVVRGGGESERVDESENVSEKIIG